MVCVLITYYHVEAQVTRERREAGSIAINKGDYYRAMQNIIEHKGRTKKRRVDGRTKDKTKWNSIEHKEQ